MSRIASMAQSRAARALLDWSMGDLSEAAQVSISTVRRLEDGRQRVTSGRAVALVQRALEARGVCFLLDDELGLGVTLKEVAGR